MTLNIKSLSAVAPRAFPLQPIGHFRYIKIKHDSESAVEDANKENKKRYENMFIHILYLRPLRLAIMLNSINHWKSCIARPIYWLVSFPLADN